MFKKFGVVVTALVSIAIFSLGLSSASTAATCSRSSDGNYHVTATGCTAQQAYLLAQSGETIFVDGSVPGQTVLFDSSKTGTNLVVFQGTSGNKVNGDFTLGQGGGSAPMVGPHNIELRDLNITGDAVTRWGSDNIIFRNLNAARYLIDSSANVQVLGGDYGPSVDSVNTIDGRYANNILIDGVRHHDSVVSDPAKHSECAQYWPGGPATVTVKNSIFERCTDFGILVKAPNMTLVMYNNMFDIPMPGNTATTICDGISPGVQEGTGACARGGNSVRLSTYTYPNSSITYNSMLGGLGIDCNCVPRNNNLVGGTAPYIDSVTTDGSMDLHLKQGASVINTGTAPAPSTDIDGQARPYGSAPDPGADEWYPSTPTDTTPPVMTLPADISVIASNSSGSVVTYTVTATDNQDPSPTVSCSPVSGSLFPIGQTTVNCLAKDASGNQSTGSFLVTVTADQPPSSPSNLSLVSFTESTVTISWSASTDDVGIANYKVYLDGVLVSTLDQNTRQADVSVIWGQHVIKVEAVDTSGQTASDDMNIKSIWTIV